MSFSRRGFLKALGVAAGASIGGRIVPGAFSGEGTALAAEEPASLVILHFNGGYNALWAAAKGLVGKFGVTNGAGAANFTELGNGVSMDNILVGALSPFAKQHVATIGVAHGQSSHTGAQASVWSGDMTGNAGSRLAGLMGGTNPNKALRCGPGIVKSRPEGVVNGVSFESVLDLEAYLASVGGGGPGAREPDRTRMLAGITASETMSKNNLDANPGNLSEMRQGFGVAKETLKLPAATIDLAELKTAYGVPAGTNKIANFASKLAAAELFVRTGANVISLDDGGGWDSHDDTTGERVRDMMKLRVPALTTFIQRMITADSTRNVVFCIMGDFSRSLPGSDHQPNLSATVIGKHVKRGSTGNVDINVGLPSGTPGSAGLWAYLAAVTKTAGAPFGANPHNLIV